jgi:hypothetical protein
MDASMLLRLGGISRAEKSWLVLIHGAVRDSLRLINTEGANSVCSRLHKILFGYADRFGLDAADSAKPRAIRPWMEATVINLERPFVKLSSCPSLSIWYNRL